MRSWFGINIFFLFIFTAASSNYSGVSLASSATRIDVGYVPLISHLPVLVSHTNNRLNEHVSVQLSRYSSITAMEAAIRVGATDAALVPLPIALSLSADEVAIKILGSLSRGGSMLIARNPGDYSSLRGKIIGVPGLESSENILLKQILDGKNLRYGLDYKVISVPISSVLNDLKSGRVDAIIFPEPFGSIALSEGYGFTIDDSEKDLHDLLSMVIVVKDSLLHSAKHNALAEWLQNLIKTCETLNEGVKTGNFGHLAGFYQRKEAIDLAIANNSGGIRFNPQPPNYDEIRHYLEKIIQMKIVYKLIALENLVEPSLLMPPKTAEYRNENG